MLDFIPENDRTKRIQVGMVCVWHESYRGADIVSVIVGIDRREGMVSFRQKLVLRHDQDTVWRYGMERVQVVNEWTDTYSPEQFVRHLFETLGGYSWR